MQLAPFHQPHVSQMPDAWLYQSLSVSRAVSAREMAVWAEAVAPRREMRETGSCGLIVTGFGAELCLWERKKKIFLKEKNEKMD